MSSLFWDRRSKIFVLQKLGSSAAIIPPEFSQCILSKIIQVLLICQFYHLGPKSWMKTSLSFEKVQVLVYHTYFTAGSSFHICSKLVSKLMYILIKAFTLIAEYYLPVLTGSSVFTALFEIMQCFTDLSKWSAYNVVTKCICIIQCNKAVARLK